MLSATLKPKGLNQKGHLTVEQSAHQLRTQSLTIPFSFFIRVKEGVQPDRHPLCTLYGMVQKGNGRFRSHRTHIMEVIRIV